MSKKEFAVIELKPVHITVQFSRVPSRRYERALITHEGTTTGHHARRSPTERRSHELLTKNARRQTAWRRRRPSVLTPAAADRPLPGAVGLIYDVFTRFVRSRSAVRCVGHNQSNFAMSLNIGDAATIMRILRHMER